jgi:hypothetical protein
MILIEETSFTLLESNLVDADFPTYEDTISYDTESVVMSGDYVYQSRSDANVGNHPAFTPLKWALIGIKNTKAIFDKKYIHLKSYASEKIEFLIDACSPDVVVFGGLEAVTIKIEQIKNGEIFKTYTQRTAKWSGNTFREYVFEHVGKNSRAVVRLAPLIKQQLKITIENPGGIARCSYMVIGKKSDIGKTLPRGQISIEDFSKKERTDEGVIYLKQGKVIEDGAYTILIQREELDAVKTKIKERAGLPTVFIPTCMTTTIIYGFVKGFRPTLDTQTIQYTIEIEEI